MSSASLARLVSTCIALTFATLIVRRLVRLPGRALTYVAAAFALLTFVAGLSLAGQVAADEWPRHAVVVGSGETPARFEPADDGTVHFSLPQGATVRVTEEREGWLQIARCDGRRGWVPAAALETL
jgi:SH3-like domain-containing protein